MGEEAETEAEAAEQISIPQLPIFSQPAPRSAEQPGMEPSPLHTAASVPFRWEEQPGKPRPCTALSLPTTTTTTNGGAAASATKCLELPPRLLYSEAKSNMIPSPTTVLEGPYPASSHLGSSRSIFQSHSFRFIRGKSRSPETALLGVGGPMVLSSSSSSSRRLLFGSSLSRRTFSFSSSKTDQVRGAGFIFEADTRCGGGNSSSSSSDDDAIGWAAEMEVVKVTTVKSKKRSRFDSISQARSNFWATIHGALKQVIPRRSNKWRKDGY
ncbi:hypothetical protein Dimus_006658 [Dionaea muscipula]